MELVIKAKSWATNTKAQLAAGATALMGLSAASLMAAPPTPEEQVGDALSTAAEGIFDTVLAVAIEVLPYAAVLVGLFIGWSMVRRFISS